MEGENGVPGIPLGRESCWAAVVSNSRLTYSRERADVNLQGIQAPTCPNLAPPYATSAAKIGSANCLYKHTCNAHGSGPGGSYANRVHNTNTNSNTYQVLV